MKHFTLMILALLTLNACEDLPLGDKTSVNYWADLYLDVYADKLLVGELEPGPGSLSEPRTVLLITGVTIRAQWFDPIVARLERDGFRPVVYEPPALLSGSLFQATYDFAEVVDQVLADSGQEKIDVLAECTGGVVARHYIQSMGGDEKVSRLVTFVSPHHGIDKAPLAATIAGWPALYDLSPGSAFLEAVTSVPLPENVPVTSIYTCTDEYIQPWQGSIIEGAHNIGLCDGFVGHFETFYDPSIYLIMHEALTEATPAELAQAEAEAVAAALAAAEAEAEALAAAEALALAEAEAEALAQAEAEAEAVAAAEAAAEADAEALALAEAEAEALAEALEAAEAKADALAEALALAEAQAEADADVVEVADGGGAPVEGDPAAWTQGTGEGATAQSLGQGGGAAGSTGPEGGLACSSSGEPGSGAALILMALGLLMMRRRQALVAIGHARA